MAARLVIALISVHSIFNNAAQALDFGALISHLADKGTSVAKLPWKTGQISKILNSTDLFHINDGDVVVAKDLAGLVHQTLPLTIEHSLGDDKWLDTLRVKITPTPTTVSHQGIFSCTVFNGSVLENQPIGTHVKGIGGLFNTAHDVTYELVYSKKNAFTFVYDSTNVEASAHPNGIATAELFDRETHPLYTLIIKAQRGEVSEEATVYISIDDENDNIPSFPKYEYEVTVDYADVISGSPILSVPATDLDIDTIHYRLTPNDVFHVDGSGNIFIGDIYHIQSDRHALELVAIDSINQQSIPVHIIITITSDLKFVSQHHRVRRQSQTTASVTIDETASVIYTFQSPGFTTTYSIVSSSIPDLFRIDGQNLRLQSNKRLDYEVEGQRSMNVEVNILDGVDIRETKTILITVTNVNDESPYFISKPEPYLATVSQTTAEGTKVFTLMALDPDGPLANVEYFLMSGGESRFAVGATNGWVTVVGSTTFPLGKEYFLTVEARDIAANPVQRTSQKNVQIYVGERAPQIFEPRYVVDVPENSRTPYLVETIKARRFQEAELRYELRDNLGGDPSAFTITSDGPEGGEVKLIQTLNYEDTQPTEYNLKVIVSEMKNAGLASTVQLLISVTDINDNDPQFPLSTYIERDIPESAVINTPILNVTATDQDSGKNAELVFTVDNPLFAVDTLGNSGILKVNGRLDFDRMLGHRYEFLVIATDKGDSPRSGSATVIVLVTNVNDEDPVFSTDLKAEVLENANDGQYVHTVHVTDPDGDNVKVYFLNDNGGRSSRYGSFEITPDTGRVFLRQGLPQGVTYYALNLTAEDDGSCCNTPGITRTSQATLIVEIVDVNDNRPVFPDCLDYQSNPPSVKENSPIGSPVFKVTADDIDQGANGEIRYAFLSTTQVRKFNINSTSGQITVAQEIDREERDGARDIGITIEASDQGTPKLNGICSFRILVDDVNDNSPVFTTPVYEVQIAASAPMDKSVIRLVANDADSGDNRRVEYLLIENPDYAFKLNNETGIVRLNKTLEGISNLQPLVVMAKDHGQPERLNSTARVTFTIKANAIPPPVWVGNIATTPFHVNETHTLSFNDPVAKIRATTTTNDRVNFLLITDEQVPVDKIDPFAIYRPPGLNDEMHLYLRSRLDFEQKESYQLKIRAAVQSANSDIIVSIMVEDQNDEYPSFRGYNPAALTINGSLTENRGAGQTVVTLQAIDTDKSEQFRRLRFSFWEDDNGAISRNFSINPNTGEITTRTTFDLESHLPNGIIRFTVKVDDRVPSADPAVQPGQPNSATATVEVLILDENDNEPRFNQSIYRAEVYEDVDIGYPVLTLAAKDLDKDSQMEFSIVTAGNDFTVERRTGIVRVATLLDYEDLNRRRYNVTVQVYDGTFVDTAYMEIIVKDANDNAPTFSQNPYQVKNIYENDTRVQVIVRVQATDPDTERPNDIEYSLNGPLSDDGTFRIDRKTGEITVTKALDRDYPNGRGVYEFNVLAVDEPTMPNKRTGVSYVQVFPIDINDNSPRFDTDLLEGSVQEHRSANPLTRVFAVNAVDYDEGINAKVEYTIVDQDQANGLNIFGISLESGQIDVVTVNKSVLDREVKASYTITVRASDMGPRTPLSQPTDQQITINLEDINDQKPVFSQKIYRTTMSENLPEDFSVTSVTASDMDVGINAQLIYTLEKDADKGYFKIDTRNATNEGILRVYKTSKIDYENVNLRFFNVTVSVDDVPSPNHKVLAYIEVTVEDFNDNAPEFVKKSITTRYYENITVGSQLATFTASDADGDGDNNVFEYSIDHGLTSDPRRQFRIDQQGVVSLNKPLDRETNATHNVQILAIDKGTPPQTGRATLTIEVLDVNDNAPDFAEKYVVYFDENKNEVQRWPGTILATDPDIPENGPPFTFALPCNYAPCCPQNPYCDLFNMTFSNDKPHEDGSATVRTTLRSFDREHQAEYFLPIVMWDSGIPVMTGTRSLHIVIKDENDNHHEAALKRILVYSYEGFRAFDDVEIGRVYAKDPDDWDVVDKEFSLVGEAPKYFRVVKETGMIHISGKPVEGVYGFEVGVFDKHFNEFVKSEVEITVKGIPSEAVYSSGSVRFDGITSRDFVERPHAASGAYGEYDASKYDKFKTEMAKKLSVPENNVDIFSVRDNADGSADIRFAAHGSPWYKPTKLDGLVTTNKADFEQNVGVKIGMVPIDECVYEICDHGCYNQYFVSDRPVVIAGNSTSFVGVDAYMKWECNTCNSTSSKVSDCTCKAGEFPVTCRNDFCYNGGTCYMDDWNEMRCKCDDGFDGSRCQQTKHSFTGDGWALYPALAQCEFGQTSLEFITTRSDCLIFYNGAMDRDGEQDFISLELINGAPYLRIDHGTGTLNLTMGNLKLADNKWHRIDISSAGKMITLTVDSCMSAVITEDVDTSTEDRTSCEVSGKTPGENKFLNVNTLLQMGGTFAQPPFIPTGLNSFTGCIKHFKHLGLLYDLYMGNTGLHKNTADGCPQEEKSCGSENSIDGLVCGKNGTCVGNLNGGTPTCICKPGWMGDKCIKATPEKDFRTESYIAWEVTLETKPDRNNVQVNFRTRDKDGVLFTAMSASRAEHLTLQIRDYYLQAVFHAKTSVTLRLDKIRASNGHWHTAYLERFGKHLKLYMDSGEGPYYAESTGLDSTGRTFVISKNDVYGGAIVAGTNVQNPEINDYENSCLSDVRMEETWFPMATSVIANGVRAITVKSVVDGCHRDDCLNVPDCGLNRVCVPLWGAYDCKCRSGFVEGGNSTCVSACRCENGGTCVYTTELERGYTCTCPQEYTGIHCETEVSSLYREASLSPEGMAAILVCVFLLLVLLVAVFLYVRLKKPKDKLMLDDDPYDDIRENVVNYDEDGAGEEDQNAFDITRIRIPVDSAPLGKTPYESMPRRAERPLQSSLPPGDLPDVGNFISGRLKDADDDYGAPPHDSVREFVNEGGGSDAGSLSSLNTSTSSGDQDYDYLNEWGPKFAKLADMYGAGQTDED